MSHIILMTNKEKLMGLLLLLELLTPICMNGNNLRRN